MDEGENRAVVERKWRACSHPGDWAELEQLYHDDAVIEWPQSGERIVGRDNIVAVHRNRPGGPPHQTLRRIVGSSDVWFSEQLGDYGGQVFCGSSIFELRDGKIARETDYFGEPFEPPAWRAAWATTAG